ncbi:MAG: AmmeMemoRadiSam system radical SAM enzyme [Deltaproteobacteria bacterium]|nr:AmmeMemoRadiSam system radical SAM enzyme [Deltaproteobacteria bacterium]
MSQNMTRKEFLKTLGLGACALYCANRGFCPLVSANEKAESIKGEIFKNDAPSKPGKWSIEAFHYETEGKDVRCQLCPHECYLTPGDRGVCRSRANIKGKLYSLSYGNPCAVNVDPIEKKPLFHFYPGTSVFSLAVAGCNFRCLNCQNWEISQRRPEDLEHYDLFPEDVIKLMKKGGYKLIAYTYSEPTSFYEYMYDTAKLAKESGFKSLWISNGYINEMPLVELARYIDGANINLKSFEDGIYQKLNGGTLEPVLNTFRTLHEEGVWFEITTLVVPTYLDDRDMIKRMCAWILKDLGPDYPLHFIRFHPEYKLTRLPSTPIETLEEFRNIAMKEGIHYVYVGNVPGHEGESTYCHNCKKILIERNGYVLKQVNIENGKCKFCGTAIPGRWTVK